MTFRRLVVAWLISFATMNVAAAQSDNNAPRDRRLMVTGPVAVVCQPGSTQTELNGPFARFHVKAGEATNLGVLKLQYWSKYVVVNYTYTMKRSVEAMTPERKAELAKAYPNLFPKAVERRMEVVGAEEGDMTKRGKSILFGTPCPRGVAICP